MLTSFLKFKKLTLSICIVVVLFTTLALAPSQARAQAATVPIGTSFDFNSIMAHLKDFVLDKAAVAIANQLLQRMTASIVGWINSGFQGSPAFIQNPQAFFLDVGDQVTGEFLMGSSLSALCSPISLDLRLSLALSRTEMLQKRYTCTLGTIIDAQKNGPQVYVNGKLINPTGGGSMNNFLKGDFNSGGWPAFMALTTEPQNNQYGAFLMAQSDLAVAINKQQATIRADLQMGSGFMSWEKCKDVTAQANAGAYDNYDKLFKQGDQKVSTGKTDLAKNTSLKSTVDKSGNIKYEDCQTETPGSLIGGSLQRQLNVPADKLVLVKTISDSIDSIMGALVNQMLTKGLSSLTHSGSGTGNDNRAYLTQLQDQANKEQIIDARTTGTNISNNVTVQSNTLASYKGIYDQAVSVVQVSKTAFERARDCFAGKITSLSANQYTERAYADNKISQIDSKISGDIAPLLQSLVTMQSTAASMLAEQNRQTAANAANSSGDYVVDTSSDPMYDPFNDLQGTINNSQTRLKSNIASMNLTPMDMTQANKDLKEATNKASDFNKQYYGLQQACDAFPSTMFQ